MFDGISASLVARTGFEAAYLTGAGSAASGWALAGMRGVDPEPMLPGSPRALFDLMSLREWEQLGERHRY